MRADKVGCKKKTEETVKLVEEFTKDSRVINWK